MKNTDNKIRHIMKRDKYWSRWDDPND
jgi:hypothetical protein